MTGRTTTNESQCSADSVDSLDSVDSVDRRGRILRLHRFSAAVLAVLLALTGTAAWLTHVIVRDQENRLLRERANEVDLVLGTSITATTTQLSTLGTIARDGGTTLFTQEAAADVTTGTSAVTFALLRPAAGSYVVIAEAGHGLIKGETVGGLTATVLAAAQRGSAVVATPVLGSGANRTLGFALGGTGAPAGTVVYRQSALGPVHAPRQAGTTPFHELRVVLYASTRPDPAQVLVTTTADLPLRGSVQYLPLTAGASHWLLGVSQIQPLVGSVAASAWWVVLISGIAGSVLIWLTLEQVARRRDAAVELYQREHRMAETLQRKLLPSLPTLSGLDIASRYVAASDGQHVGGDWFDVFDLGDRHTGVVIGDVIGHDVDAAAAMAEVRSALRAYAWESSEPAPVIKRLARLVDAFDIAGLVTVVYGVLGPPDEAGARWFQWANAGHPPPLLQLPDGHVDELGDGSSTVIGAPSYEPRSQGRRLLPPGAKLVLYTDGLVELPGVDLGHSLEHLRVALRCQTGDTSASDVCESMLRAQSIQRTRDDIAIVVVRILEVHQAAGRLVPELTPAGPSLPPEPASEAPAISS